MDMEGGGGEGGGGGGRCGQTPLQTCLGTGGWPYLVTGHVPAAGKHQHCCYNKTYKQRMGGGGQIIVGY